MDKLGKMKEAYPLSWNADIRKTAIEMDYFEKELKRRNKENSKLKKHTVSETNDEEEIGMAFEEYYDPTPISHGKPFVSDNSSKYYVPADQSLQIVTNNGGQTITLNTNLLDALSRSEFLRIFGIHSFTKDFFKIYLTKSIFASIMSSAIDYELKKEIENIYLSSLTNFDSPLSGLSVQKENKNEKIVSQCAECPLYRTDDFEGSISISCTEQEEVEYIVKTKSQYADLFQNCPLKKHTITLRLK